MLWISSSVTGNHTINAGVSLGKEPWSSRTNVDDRLPLVPLGRVEGGDGVVEG